MIDTIDRTFPLAVPWAWERNAAAGPHSAEATCVQYAATSDGLFLILGEELTDITKKEYLAARDAGVPCFILVKDGVQQSEAAKRFVRREGRLSTYRRFGDLADLREQVAWAIYYYSIRAWRARSIPSRQPAADAAPEIAHLLELCNDAYLAGRFRASAALAADIVAACDARNLPWLAARARMLLASRQVEAGYRAAATTTYGRAQRLANGVGDFHLSAAALMGRARAAAGTGSTEVAARLRSEAALAWAAAWGRSGVTRSRQRPTLRLGAPGAMLILIAGPSGVGVDTVLDHLVPMARGSLHVPRSWTTRPLRSGEDANGPVTHVTRDDFDAAVARGEMLVPVEVLGNWYGMARRELADPLVAGRDVLLKVDLQAASELKSIGSASIGIAPQSLEVLLDRHKQRDPTIRAEDAQTALTFLTRIGFDYLVTNETNAGERAAREVLALLRDARLGHEDRCVVL